MPKFIDQYTQKVNDDADDIGGFFHSRKGMWTGIALVVGCVVGFAWVGIAQLIGFFG